MQAKNITYGYETGKNLFNNLNVQLKRGKITTIIGPNGCGKSTLLGLLTKAYQPLEGEVLLEGTSIKKIKGKEFSKQVAVVHQQNLSELEITVEELVSYGRSPYQGLRHQPKDDQEIIDWALECTKLIDIKGKRVNELSGGQRQRAWIAMSICQKTDILFLDEPTTYLDIQHQIDLLELVRELNERFSLTIVMVLHDINQALQYSDYLIVMKEGRLVREGVPKEIIDEGLLEEVYHIKAKIYQEGTLRYILPYGIVSN